MAGSPQTGGSGETGGRRRSAPPDQRMAEMLRVDHAGEYGAVAIYGGQQAVFSRGAGTGRASRIVAEMAQGEAEHLETFDRLLTEHGVRPTALMPLWTAAGHALGALTALMGEKAAFACTEAVEEVIAEHYRDQARELDRRGDKETAALFRRFADEEEGHHDTAVAEGARQAAGHRLLTGLIKAGCRAAIGISQKI